ncbi:ankyrin repeat domain-containing protein [Propioniciclava coleopterorum]|uniref:Ankyrin repeat domain-containing protein n=1 Tax=Propioniciclava coleopterorum TaxID=2714937 RepID=A0A6G7Y9T1_9ACTN|nr:ankyrin repeat domain-containing protein [Propioniciclava coleopterorum]QIK73479.1 ankyrin repeat domain-containing protein [Propioniciclava coleopterorum]
MPTAPALGVLVGIVAGAVLTACTPGPAAEDGSHRTDAAGPESPRPESTDAEADGRLRDAAWAGDVDAATRLIAAGADVDAKDATEQSAYLIATSEGHLDLLELTLSHGADVAALDSWNGTGLIRAAERGHWLVTGRLLRAGIARDHVNRIGYQAIHEAIWLGRDDDAYVATVRILAAGGADLTRASGRRASPPPRWPRSADTTARPPRWRRSSRRRRPPIPTPPCSMPPVAVTPMP